MVLLQVMEATDLLLKSSQEQTYLVFFQTVLIVALMGFAFWSIKRLEAKNQEVQISLEKKNDEVKDCLKNQLMVDEKIKQYAHMVDSHLLSIHKALQNKDTDTLKRLIAQLGFESRKDL